MNFKFYSRHVQLPKKNLKTFFFRRKRHLKKIYRRNIFLFVKEKKSSQKKENFTKKKISSFKWGSLRNEAQQSKIHKKTNPTRSFVKTVFKTLKTTKFSQNLK